MMPTLTAHLPPMCEVCFDEIGFQHMVSPWQWTTSDDVEDLGSYHQSGSSMQGRSELTEHNLDQHDEQLQKENEALRNANMREEVRDNYRNFLYDEVVNGKADRQDVLDYLEYHYRMYTPFFAEVAESEAIEYEDHQNLARVYRDVLEEAGPEGRERALAQLEEDWGEHDRYGSVANSEEVAWLRENAGSSSNSDADSDSDS